MSLALRPFVFWGFACTSDAMAAADACSRAGVPARLAQRPAALGDVAECGTALRARPQDEERVRLVLAEAGIAASGSCRQDDLTVA